MKYLRYLLNENDKLAGTYGEPHKIEKVKFGGVLSTFLTRNDSVPDVASERKMD